VWNPIYVFDPAEQDARRQRSLLPVRDVSPPKLMVDNFESASSFEPGSDASTVVDRNVTDVRGGVDGSIWVQVRDENTRSEDGTEWWYTSVRSAREWRRVAIPFQQFRTRDPASDGRRNLDKARGIVFILDPGVAKPGRARRDLDR
jgi:hypothetical protein